MSALFLAAVVAATASVPQEQGMQRDPSLPVPGSCQRAVYPPALERLDFTGNAIGVVRIRIDIKGRPDSLYFANANFPQEAMTPRNTGIEAEAGKTVMTCRFEPSSQVRWANLYVIFPNGGSSGFVAEDRETFQKARDDRTPSKAMAAATAARNGMVIYTGGERIEGTCQEPRYPEMLRSAGMEGEVMLSYAVSVDGTVDPTSFRVARTAHDLFSGAARTAIQSCRFTPPLRNGQPAATSHVTTVAFRLKAAEAATPTVRGVDHVAVAERVPAATIHFPRRPDGYRPSKSGSTGYSSWRGNGSEACDALSAGELPCFVVYYDGVTELEAETGAKYRAFELCFLEGGNGFRGSGHRRRPLSRGGLFTASVRVVCSANTQTEVAWNRSQSQRSSQSQSQGSSILGTLGGIATTVLEEKIKMDAERSSRGRDQNPEPRSPTPSYPTPSRGTGGVEPQPAASPPSQPSAPEVEQVPLPRIPSDASQPTGEPRSEASTPNRAAGCGEFVSEGNSWFVRNRCRDVRILVSWYDEGYCKTGCADFGMQGIGPGQRSTISGVTGRRVIATCEYPNLVVVTGRDARGWPTTYQCR